MNAQEAFAILSSADRRHIVRELIDGGGLSTIETLSHRIAARRRETAPVGANGEALERAKISLIHNHLPWLEDHGVIEYDSRNGDVVLDEAEALESYLAEIDVRNRSIPPEQ